MKEERLGYVFYNGKSSSLPVLLEDDYDYFAKAENKDILEYDLGIPYKVKPSDSFVDIDSVATKWVEMDEDDRKTLCAAILAYNFSLDDILEYLEVQKNDSLIGLYLFTEIRSIEDLGRKKVKDMLYPQTREKVDYLMRFINLEDLGNEICVKHNGYVVEGYGYIQKGKYL